MDCLKFLSKHFQFKASNPAFHSKYLQLVPKQK